MLRPCGCSTPESPSPAVPPVPHVSPVPVAEQCGSEAYTIACESGAAYVALPDGAIRALPRQNPKADPEAPRVYGDGRLTFTQEIEGGRAVRMARGRAATVTCSKR